MRVGSKGGRLAIVHAHTLLYGDRGRVVSPQLATSRGARLYVVGPKPAVVMGEDAMAVSD